MFPFIRIHIVIFASLHFVHTHTSRSSFFKISLQKDLHIEKDVFIKKSVRDGFHCALTCNTNTECHFSVFDKDLKKCSLLKENAKLNHQITHGSETESERKLFLEKVRFLSIMHETLSIFLQKVIFVQNGKFLLTSKRLDENLLAIYLSK